MFNKLLIANRGEIACRVIRTARSMGIKTVAVYSDADANAQHVCLADEAIHIGAAAASESYLRADKIISAAKQCGAQAIHPGYGFLSENAEFAEACASNGIAFVGPTASAIRSMGSKSGAKALMVAAGVPVVPGYHGHDQSDETLRAGAMETGFPLLVKASAGGGGKGMRIVRSPEELDDALGAARREARNAFGDDTLLLERYVEQPRHVEVQIFFDSHGHGVHLFERDCSVQRRYQKVLEEAPAPGLPQDMLSNMYEAALNAGRAVGYRGAGTVEFIVGADHSFYFMEMNTRLQVEHPVTEQITGIDLVEWQLRVADGEPLPESQDALAIHGHSVEARLYAEDPANGFLPAVGQLRTLDFPSGLGGCRIDSGVVAGDRIGIDYDPMIAKVIGYGATRAQAIDALKAALTNTQITGLTTNAGFLVRALSHPEFAAGGTDTGFLARHGDALARPEAIEAAWFARAALAHLALRTPRRRSATDPWEDDSSWRLNHTYTETITLVHGDTSVEVVLSHENGSAKIRIGDSQWSGQAKPSTNGLNVELDGHRINVLAQRNAAELTLFTDIGPILVNVLDPLSVGAQEESGGGHLESPMPGRIVSTLVNIGDSVEEGQPLIVLEAMKMEHTIAANVAGEVVDIKCEAGDLVNEGVELIVVEAQDAS